MSGEVMTDPVIVDAMKIGLTVLLTAVGTTWRVSRILSKYDTTLIQIMADHELSDTKRFAEVHSKIIESGDQVRHDVGEMGAAIRQKIYEVEMWGRDNLVPRIEFKAVAEKVEAFTKRR